MHSDRRNQRIPYLYFRETFRSLTMVYRFHMIHVFLLGSFSFHASWPRERARNEHQANESPFARPVVSPRSAPPKKTGIVSNTMKGLGKMYSKWISEFIYQIFRLNKSIITIVSSGTNLAWVRMTLGNDRFLYEGSLYLL